MGTQREPAAYLGGSDQSDCGPPAPAFNAGEAELSPVLSYRASSGCSAQLEPNVDIFRACLLTGGRAPGAPGCSATSPGPPRLGTGRRRPCIRDESQTTCNQTHTEDRVHTETPNSSGRRSRDLCGASVQLIATVYSPPGLLSRDLIVPSSSHSSSCNLQSACRYFFFSYFFLFVNLPSKNHQDCGQKASLL